MDSGLNERSISPDSRKLGCVVLIEYLWIGLGISADCVCSRLA